MKVKGDFTCDICGESFESNVEIATHVNSQHNSISRSEILSEVRRITNEIGRVPTIPEFNARADMTSGAVKSTFGSWREGLEAIGLKPYSHIFSETEIIKELRRVANELDHSPSVSEMEKHGKVSPTTVGNHFGSWNEGLEAAGLETERSTRTSEPEIIEAIQSLADRLGRPPTAFDMDVHGEYSTAVAQSLFGDWNGALSAAGYEPHVERNIADVKLLEEISRLADELNQPPTSSDMDELGQYSLKPYRRSFGSWKEAIEAAGYEYRGQPNGSSHRRWKGGYGDISYGPNWYTQRKRTLERDDFQCQMPGCGIDRERHNELFGRDLNVHHIIPIYSYIDEAGLLDYERANCLGNLVTVCQRHHQYWERIAPLKPDIR